MGRLDAAVARAVSASSGEARDVSEASCDGVLRLAFALFAPPWRDQSGNLHRVPMPDPQHVLPWWPGAADRVARERWLLSLVPRAHRIAARLHGGA